MRASELSREAKRGSEGNCKKKRDEALRIATRGADSEGSEESQTELLGVAMRSDAETKN